MCLLVCTRSPAEQADSGGCVLIRSKAHYKYHSTLKELKRGLEGGEPANVFYEASMTLILQPDKNSTRKGKFEPVSLLNINVKILNITSTLNLIVC